MIVEAKVLPIHQLIKQTQRRKDDYEWEGEGLEKVVINKLNNKPIVKIDKKFFRPAEVDLLVGDSSKIKKELNWKPMYTLDSLIEEMIAFEINNPNLSF